MENYIIEVKFKGERRELFVNVKQFQLKVGDYTIVEAEKGVDIGRVNHISPLLNSSKESDNLRKVIRKTDKEDLLKYKEIQHQENDAIDVCKTEIANHKLDMKLVDCEFQYDKNKITFYFTSENRVDFRKLVKDVARVYKTRIEFRQIGVRDEARRVGGYGVCGRKFCCTSWIKEFMPITTQAAKDQNLPLNPSKLAGVCGRLKCCLMYERDFYNQVIYKFPDLARPVFTEQGKGIVSNIDIFNDTVLVLFPDDTTENYSLDYIRRSLHQCEKKCENSNPKDLN